MMIEGFLRQQKTYLI